MISEKVTKTIIKGLKEVKRLSDVTNNFGVRPQLKYCTKKIPSDTNIQETDKYLILGNECSFLGDIFLNIVIEEKLELVPIVSVEIENEIQTIVVDKIIENEEQYFNYDLLMDKYNKLLDEFYNKFIKTYKNDKIIMLEINKWIDNGISKEDIIDKLSESNKISYSNSSVFFSNDNVTITTDGDITLTGNVRNAILSTGNYGNISPTGNM